ncbi:dirigent protein 1-like [Zingiber officinale]|uniref:dirigent protein 1-like n=1 Tax=Zingiber officinale TaxID=94328 RepID=UPI001C4B4B4F|nr:dirigent protein 1-like [Zingiber officinale]
MASSSFVFCLLLALFAAATTTASPNPNGYMHLRFYNHERILGSGPDATVVYAVERTSSTSGAGFGNVIVYDNLLRAGVEPDSPIIGRNQGMGVGSSLAENSGLTNFQLVFTAGKYNGSSLALQGLFPVAPLGTVFERAITGGTGKFRLARGYLLTTESTSNTDSVIRPEQFIWLQKQGNQRLQNLIAAKTKKLLLDLLTAISICSDSMRLQVQMESIGLTG